MGRNTDSLTELERLADEEPEEARMTPEALDGGASFPAFSRVDGYLDLEAMEDHD